MVPSSPKVPCNTGKTTSSDLPPGALAAEEGSGASRVGMPSCSSLAPGVASGSPARSLRSNAASPCCSSACASPAESQRPCLVMPMGTTSNLLRSIAFRMDAAESSETSCSPLRPPNRMPTRSFFAICRCSAFVRAKRTHPVYRRYRIFFPNAEQASSTARSAVRLCSSMTGLTSTSSKLSMPPWSAMISMARCASR